MAKKHLELVREKVLDGFESDETLQYEVPKQRKDETVKLKNFHRLKAKKRLSGHLIKKTKKAIIEISDDDETPEIEIIKSTPAPGKQVIHPAQKFCNRLARKKRQKTELYRDVVKITGE